MPSIDLNIVNKAKAGDRAAFRMILEQHYAMIVRVAYRFLGHQADAEDIAQDVCAALPEKLQSFRGDSSFSTWIYRVVVNACRDLQRKQSNHRDLDRDYNELEKNLTAEGQEAARKSAWLYRSLATLGAEMKETALLVVAEGLNHAEAAAILDCAESTISWRMHEVRKSLKAMLDTYP